MEKISIFNYEAYYLDFLEGNLSEDDGKLLMTFLAENPSLKLDDDSLPLFELDEYILDNSVKNELKQPNVEDEITQDNVTHFMIAQAEGLLKSDKSIELNEFILKDDGLLHDQKVFSSVYLKPDLELIYEEKNSLKQRRVVALWPYFSVAAACVAVIIMIWSVMNSQQLKVDGSETIVAKKIKGKDYSQNTPNEEEVRLAQESDPIRENNASKETQNKPVIDQRNSSNVRIRQVENMEKRPVALVLTSFMYKEIEPITKKIIAVPTGEVATQDYAMIHFGDMQNPIEPITEFLGQKTNRKIDFRTAKRTQQKPGGFYLKIGKFELSRKKH